MMISVVRMGNVTTFQAPIHVIVGTLPCWIRLLGNVKVANYVYIDALIVLP